MNDKYKLTLALIRKITKEWNECFPRLEIYKPMRLLRRVGPLLMGICLEVKSDKVIYYPPFHVHNLSRISDITASLVEPLRTSYGAADWVQVRMHEKKYIESTKYFTKNSSVPLKGDVKLTKLINHYEYYLIHGLLPIEEKIYEDVVLI